MARQDVEAAATIAREGWGDEREQTESGINDYSAAEVRTAVVHGRQDVASLFVLMAHALERLEGIRFVLWLIALLLAFIAWKLA